MKVKEKKIKKEESKSPKKSKEFKSPGKKKESPKKTKNKIIGISSPNIQKSDRFPKNANEFKHIMEDITCGVSDIEYMLQLRRHKKITNLNKNLSASSPSFYDDDLRKYKNKLNKKSDERRLFQTNIAKFRQIFSDRARYAINDTQFKFEVSLRSDPYSSAKNINRNAENKEKQNNFFQKKTRWNPPVIPRSKSLFDTILPPVLSRSKEIFAKLDDKIARPIISVKKDGYINGEKVKRRIFEYNKNIALRFPSEHFPSSRYVNDYGLQNIGSFKHLLNFDNKTMTSSWTTHLRNQKKPKFLPEETKKREKRLRDKSNEKTYPKS